MKVFQKKKSNEDIESVMQEVEAVLKKGRVNPEVSRSLVKFIKEDLPTATGIFIIWEKPGKKKAETFYATAGIEPIQAISDLDQLHHRIQHEGLANYD